MFDLICFRCQILSVYFFHSLTSLKWADVLCMVRGHFALSHRLRPKRFQNSSVFGPLMDLFWFSNGAGLVAWTGSEPNYSISWLLFFFTVHANLPSFPLAASIHYIMLEHRFCNIKKWFYLILAILSCPNVPDPSCKKSLNSAGAASGIIFLVSDSE